MWRIQAALTVGALALVGCVSYQPGALARGASADTAVVAAGCLDVAARVTSDPVAAWPVVDLQFGNRCDRAVPVDLRAIAAFGHTRGGVAVSLVVYDPMAQLRTLPLEARTTGGELLQYRDRRDLGEVGPDIVDVCLDLAGVAGGAPQVRCFARPPQVAQAEGTP